MSCEPGRRSGRRLAALAAALLLAWPVAAQQPAGGESPHAVLERARAAAEAGDWGELASCLAPADRTRLTWDTILITGMMLDHAFMAEQRLAEEAEASGQVGIPDDEAEPSAGNEEIAARLHALLDDHGVHRVPQDEVLEAEPAEVLAGVDQVSLLPRLMAVLVELTGDEEEEGTEGGMAPIDLPLPAGELTDVVTDGATARGEIGGQQVGFLQVDGRWYLSLESEEPALQERTTPADPNAVPRPEEGAETPQALVERLRQAARDQDFAVAAACLAPDEREEALVVLMFAPVLLLAAEAEEPSPGDDATVRDLLSLVGEAERIRDEYQLAAVFDRLHREMIENPEGALGTKLPEDSLGEIDRMALLADLLALTSRFGAAGNEGEPHPHPLYNPPPGELRELYVHEDHATGKLGGEGPLDGMPITFARFDGRWYVRMIQ